MGTTFYFKKEKKKAQVFHGIRKGNKRKGKERKGRERKQGKKRKGGKGRERRGEETHMLETRYFISNDRGPLFRDVK